MEHDDINVGCGSDGDVLEPISKLFLGVDRL
jgi:hypothetical protein